MKFIESKNRLFIIIVYIVSSFIASCGSKDTTKVSEEIGLSPVKEENKLGRDNAKVENKIAAYTYIVESEEVPVPVIEADEIKSDRQVKPLKISKRSGEPPQKVEPRNVLVEDTGYEDIPQVDVDLFAILDELTINRPPLFNKKCLQEKRPAQCSDESIEEYVQANLVYPDRAIEAGHEGLEHVIFRVTKEGIVENIKVRSKDKPCIGCAQAARDVVALTSGKWVPALRNGKPVNTKVTLPVRLKVNQ